MRRLLVAWPLLVVSGCFGAPVHDETLDGPWRLVATDVDADAVLCVQQTPNSCFADGLPGPEIFAAGANANYVVAARHPADGNGGVDASLTQYYFVVRQPGDRTHILKGPLTEAQFAAAKKRFGLPEFTATLD